MVATNEVAFDEISQAMTPEHRTQWAQMERDALAARVAQPEAMDIYDVKMQKRAHPHDLYYLQLLSRF